MGESQLCVVMEGMEPVKHPSAKLIILATKKGTWGIDCQQAIERLFGDGMPDSGCVIVDDQIVAGVGRFYGFLRESGVEPSLEPIQGLLAEAIRSARRLGRKQIMMPALMELFDGQDARRVAEIQLLTAIRCTIKKESDFEVVIHCRRPETNRYLQNAIIWMTQVQFFSRQQLDALIDANKVELEADRLKIRNFPVPFQMSSGVKFVGVDSGIDLAQWLGKVVSLEGLRKVGAEIASGAVIHGDTAYRVLEGFLLIPQVELGRGAPETDGGPALPEKSAEKMLEEFLLAKMG